MTLTTAPAESRSRVCCSTPPAAGISIDVEAGQRAGCQTVFVDYGYRERRPDAPYLKVRSLLEAANWIVEIARREWRRHA